RGWVETHMPDAELRRQRAAFRRGVIRTSIYAAAVVGVLAIAASFATWQASKARKALARASFSQAQAGRASGLAGQRWQSLAALRQARVAHTRPDEVRDEAIACLALVDLKEETNALALSVRSHTNRIAFAPNRDLAAIELPDGGIAVHWWREGTQVGKLAGVGWRVKCLPFSPTPELIAD